MVQPHRLWTLFIFVILVVAAVTVFVVLSSPIFHVYSLVIFPMFPMNYNESFALLGTVLGIDVVNVNNYSVLGCWFPISFNHIR